MTNEEKYRHALVEISKKLNQPSITPTSERIDRCKQELCWLLGTDVLKRGCSNSRSMGNFEPILLGCGSVRNNNTSQMEQMPNPMFRKYRMANPNIYGNKYGQPGYLWNNWPDICGMRIGVKLVCA